MSEAKALFEKWWHNFGSGMPPYPHDDYEEHAHRVAAEAFVVAYSAGKRFKFNSLHPKTEASK